MKFLEQGIAAGLGSDSVASNNVCDLLDEARYALLLARTVESQNDRRLSAEDALRLATAGGAQALGWQDRIGVLAPGFAAVKSCARFTSAASDSQRSLTAPDPAGG